MKTVPLIRLRLCRSFLLLVAGLVLPLLARAGIGDIDPTTGWSTLQPSADSRLVYVSSSQGDDSNDGLSEQTPKRTIDAANALIRDGYPDWLLLKRGDTFEQPSLGRWKSGRSKAEPLVMTYYGSTGPRPLIRLTDKLVDWNGQPRNHTAYVGLHLYRAISDPDAVEFQNEDCDTAFRFIPGELSGASNVLIEDCRLRYCWIVTQGNREFGHYINNVYIRRNIVVNNWMHGSLTSHAGRIQGQFASMNYNFYFEENFFDHNGWSEVIEDANANQYNHNLYMSIYNDGEIVVRGNVMSRGAAHGVQLRSGGTAEMNAFVGNAIGINLGYKEYPASYTGDTFALDNVVTDGRPQIPGVSTNPQSGAIWGFYMELINNVSVDGNIVANIADPSGVNMRPYQDMTANEFGSGNIGWNWHQMSEPSVDPGWLDPNRNADSYAATLGLSNWEAVVDLGSSRELGTMPYGLTAYAYVNYIREGFNKSGVVAPYSYEPGIGAGAGHVAVTGIILSPETADVIAGDSIVMNAAVVPSNATNQSISWSSSDPAIASVSSMGVVTANAAGTATITAVSSEGGYQETAVVTVEDFGDNLSLGRPVTFSAVQEGNDKLVDGLTDDGSRWSAQNFPQWAEIDLGADYDLSLIRLYPYASRDYQYTISVAPDGSTDFQVIVDRSTNSGSSEVLVDTVAATGRYILLMVDGAGNYSGSWCSINELEVFGSPASGGSGSSGTESFNALSASTTDQGSDGSYTGDNGEVWNFGNTLLIENGISGKTAQLRRYNGFVETNIVGGLDTLNFTIQTTPGLSPSSAKMEVFIDGVSQGEFEPSAADTATEFQISNIGTSVDTTIRFDGNGHGQVWLDNVSWGSGAVTQESLGNLSASTTDQGADGSFEGDNGETWTFQNTMRVDAGIEGISAQLRRYNGYLETVVPEAFDTLSFKIVTLPGLNTASAKVEVFIAGVSYGEFQPDATDAVKTIALSNLNIPSGSLLRLDANGWGQVIVDSIDWN